MVLAEVLGISQLQVAHDVRALHVADVCPAVAVDASLLDVVRHVTLVVEVHAGIAAESTEEESVSQRDGRLSMGVERTYVEAVLYLQLSQRVVYLVGKAVFVPLACLRVLVGRVGRVVSGGRIEHLLRVVLHLSVAFTAQDTQLQLELLVEGVLRGIQLHGIVAHIRVLQCALTLYEADAGAVVAGVVARRVGDVVGLCQPGRTLYFVEPVGIAAEVGECHPHLGGSGTVSIRAQHFKVLEDGVHAQCAVVRKGGKAVLSFCRRDDDDTGCTAGSVLCRLRGILQNGHALDVAGLRGVEHGHVSEDTVDDHQRVVTAGERRGAAYADIGRPHRVATVLADDDTADLSLQGVGCRGYDTLVHVALAYTLNGSRHRTLRAYGITDDDYLVELLVVFGERNIDIGLVAYSHFLVAVAYIRENERRTGLHIGELEVTVNIGYGTALFSFHLDGHTNQWLTRRILHTSLYH